MMANVKLEEDYSNAAVVSWPLNIHRYIIAACEVVCAMQLKALHYLSAIPDAKDKRYWSKVRNFVTKVLPLTYLTIH
jgi:hypothetical protein